MPAPFVLSSDLVSAYPAKSVTLADYIDTSLAAKTDLAMTQNAQTGTSYSMALADASKLVTMSNAASNTVLVTKQATVTWVTGTQLRVMNLGAGVTTLVADTGVTINGNVPLKQYQGGTLIRTASDVWLFVPTSSSGGMDLITPTSVAGTGVTLSGGQVTFSAATTVSVNGCFTSAYENYLIELSITSLSATGAINLRYRASGSDTTTSTYNYAQSRAGRTSTIDGVSTAAGSVIQLAFQATGYPLQSRIDIFRGNASGLVGYLSHTHSYDGGYLVVVQSGICTQATAHDGFTIYPASGNVTGTLRIYGLRNS